MRPVPKNFNPQPFAYHQELELEINTLTNLGHGLGRTPEGWVVMVPFALPTERVRARVFRNYKNYSEADLVEVLRPSVERVQPRCPLFGACGGCQYQHLSADGQANWKRAQVVELLERITGLENPQVEPVHRSPRPYNYRSKLTPHYDKARGEKDEMPIGFLRNGQRNAIIDVPQCPIATEAINEALPAERARVRTLRRKLKKGGTLLLRDTLEGVQTDNNATVSERVGGIYYQFSAGEFFQNNPFILPDMVDYVMAEIRRGEGVHLRTFVDAYCGVGMFALHAAKHFEKVCGVEISEKAVHFARSNAAANQIDNVRFTLGKAEAIFADLQFKGEESAMVIDPPRAGCDEVFLRQLLDFAPQRVVYVSCDPATQARDLKTLLAGGYLLERVMPFDLFPQTRHIENVCTLRRGPLAGTPEAAAAVDAVSRATGAQAQDAQRGKTTTGATHAGDAGSACSGEQANADNGAEGSVAQRKQAL